MIYPDDNATTKINPRVLEAMMPYLTDMYANAASDHEFGHKANEAVKKARKQVADLTGADSHKIISTSSCERLTFLRMLAMWLSFLGLSMTIHHI